MVENIVGVCHEFPGVNPADVWRLRYDVWCRFVVAAQQLAKAREEANSRGGR